MRYGLQSLSAKVNIAMAGGNGNRRRVDSRLFRYAGRPMDVNQRRWWFHVQTHAADTTRHHGLCRTFSHHFVVRQLAGLSVHGSSVNKNNLVWERISPRLFRDDGNVLGFLV